LTLPETDDMVSHMKTTIDIADPLLKRAKAEAARRGTTLKVVVEEALRESLAPGRRERGGYQLKTHTFGGRGLQAGLEWGDWKALRDLAYEGRGA
jgi:hypothetical protein